MKRRRWQNLAIGFGTMPKALNVNVSTECHRMHGISLGEYTQHEFPVAFSAHYIHPDDRPDFLRAVNNAVSAQRSFDVEYRCIMPDGDLGTIHAIGEPMMDKGGDHVRTIGTVQDVTMRRQMEENLRQPHVMSQILEVVMAIPDIPVRSQYPTIEKVMIVSG